MSLLKQLEERKADVSASVQAITELVKSEKRDMTDGERKQVDAGFADLEKINGDIERARKVEAFKSDILKGRHRDNPESPVNPKPTQDPVANVVVPIKERGRGKLQAFDGPNAEKEAYIAGQFGRAIMGHSDAKEWLQARGYEVKAAMSSNDNSKGGFLIPDVLEATIVRLVEQFGVFRRNVGRVWPLASGNINVPKRSGGFTFHWTGEGQEIQESDPTLNLVSLAAKKGAMLGKVPNELFEDSAVSLGDFLAVEMAFAKAYAEDNAGFNGDGSSAFGGIKGLKNILAAGSKAIAPNSDGQTTLAGLKITTFLDAMGKIKQYAGIAPKWYMSQATWENAAKRLALAGGGNSVVDFENGMRPMFLGYPVEVAQVLPAAAPAAALTNTIVAYFGDLAMSVAMGDARQLTVVADQSRYFEFDMTGIRGTCRMDINVHERGTATEGGAVIAVQTAAS